MQKCSQICRARRSESICSLVWLDSGSSHLPFSADSHRPNLYRFAVNRGWFAAGVSQCMQENRRLCACASASSINRAERMRPSRGFTRASGPEARNLGLVCRCRHVHSIALLCSRLQTDHHLLGTICRRNNAHGYCGGEGRKRGRREQTPLPLSAMLLSISLVENIDLLFLRLLIFEM